jgi:hypothetical protein
VSAEFHDLLTEAFPEMRPPRRNLRFAAALDAPPVRLVDKLGNDVFGHLENESYSGIAVVVAAANGLRVETEISVDYFGQPVPGKIRRIVTQPDGTQLIGIEWK